MLLWLLLVVVEGWLGFSAEGGKARAEGRRERAEEAY